MHLWNTGLRGHWGRQSVRQGLYRETESLTRELLEQSEGTFTDLISAQRDVTEAERTLAGLKFSQVQGFVSLNVRLGAGHAAGKPEPAPRPVANASRKPTE